MLRIVAYILNGMLILLGLLSLAQFHICGAIVGLGAGIGNIVAIRSGGDMSDGLRNFSLFCNTIAFIVGIVWAVQAVMILSGGDLPAPATEEDRLLSGLILAAFAVAYVSAGIVTLVVVMKENAFR